MSDALTIVIAVLGSNGIWAFIQARMARKDSKKDKKEDLEASVEKTKQDVEKMKGQIELSNQAILAILHDKIYYLAQKHILSGHITVDEMENLRYLFEPYYEMGGNGTCKRLYEACLELPIVEEGHEKAAETR